MSLRRALLVSASAAEDPPSKLKTRTYAAGRRLGRGVIMLCDAAAGETVANFGPLKYHVDAPFPKGRMPHWMQTWGAYSVALTAGQCKQLNLDCPPQGPKYVAVPAAASRNSAIEAGVHGPFVNHGRVASERNAKLALEVDASGVGSIVVKACVSLRTGDVLRVDYGGSHAAAVVKAWTKAAKVKAARCHLPRVKGLCTCKTCGALYTRATHFEHQRLQCSPPLAGQPRGRVGHGPGAGHAGQKRRRDD